jgi:hypothetical protein
MVFQLSGKAVPIPLPNNHPNGDVAKRFYYPL